MDVAFLVVRSSGPWGSAQKYVVKGEWINQGFVETHRLEEKQTIKIPAVKLKEWLICLNPELKCIRYAKWGKLG